MYKRRLVRRKRPARKAKQVAKLSSPMKKAIVKVIHAQSEDKYVAIAPGFGGGRVNPGAPWSGTAGSAMFSTPNILNNVGLSTIYPCLPGVDQGVNLFTRLGNRVTPKSLRVVFSITVNPAVACSEDLVCRLLCLSDKSIKDTTALVSSPTQPGTPIESELLNNGDGSFVGFAGKPRDTQMRINRNRYTVHHDRLIKITKGEGDLSYSLNSYSGTQTFVSTGQSHQFSVRIPLPKTLQYAQDNFIYPTNAAPFWCMGVTQPSGDGTSGQVIALNNHVLVNYTSHFDFEDA